MSNLDSSELKSSEQDERMSFLLLVFVCLVVLRERFAAAILLCGVTFFVVCLFT